VFLDTELTRRGSYCSAGPVALVVTQQGRLGELGGPAVRLTDETGPGWTEDQSGLYLSGFNVIGWW
jgi:hypothetical protein